MKVKDLTQEEIDSLSYTDLAEVILKSKNTKMKVFDIFKKICSLKAMSDSEFENRIADFFELVSMDKRFVMLDGGYCDLKAKHNISVVIEDEEEEEIADSEELDENEDIESEENEEEDGYYDNSSSEDDIEDDAAEDEYSDFMIVDEDEETSI